jgi:hypothetical protein
VSVSAELQKLVYDTLVADASVSALVSDRIYDGAPSDRVFPCVTFGPTSSVSDELQCIDSRQETVQLDVWSRDSGRMRPCKEICDAVRKALHLASLSLSTNHLVRIRVDGIRVFMDADGVTSHGVVVVEADLEEM